MKYEPVQKGLQGDVSIVGESDIRPDLTGVLTFLSMFLRVTIQMYK